MITATGNIDLSQDGAKAILDYCRTTTATPYLGQRFDGYTTSYKLRGTPHFSLMEGFWVPPHNDQRNAFRPLLWLSNPQGKYILRGRDGDDIQAVSPQRRGDITILDLEKPHEVHCTDPNYVRGAWSVLAWGPAGEDLPQNIWGPDVATVAAKIQFKEFIRRFLSKILP